jgi:soluble lytic murein transglycosylase-like protein
VNLEIGAWYLSRALRRWSGYKHQLELAISEYNAGPTGMKPWIPENHDGDVIDRITIPSTRQYVRSVLDRYHWYLERRKAEPE